jgi:hypothetical protein
MAFGRLFNELKLPAARGRGVPFVWGAGAISQWRIELPKEFKQFDYDSISDVILHLRYTAREVGKALRDAAVNQLQDAVNTLAEEKANELRKKIKRLQRLWL